jgi:hypothetical protein
MKEYTYERVAVESATNYPQLYRTAYKVTGPLGQFFGHVLKEVSEGARRGESITWYGKLPDGTETGWGITRGEAAEVLEVEWLAVHVEKGWV